MGQSTLVILKVKIYAIHSMQIYEITPRDSTSSLSGRPGTADKVHERNGKNAGKNMMISRLVR